VISFFAIGSRHDFLNGGRFGIRVVLNMPPLVPGQTSLDLCIFVPVV
jgi:hypothetical protein